MTPALNAYGEEVETEVMSLPEYLGSNVDRKIRCSHCRKLLAEFAGRPWRLMCPRCKSVNGSGPPAL